MRKRPHIVIFNPDQWRGDVLGHMGNPAAKTPNLDRWVEEDAVSFSQAYCQNPICTPSRCSFMSGWYPHVRGHRTLFHMMQPDEPALLKSLKEAGYFVWWGGKNDLVPGENSLEPYCDVKYVPDREPLPSRPIEQARGGPESDSYYSFYVGRLEPPEGEDIYYDSDWANVLGAVDFIKNAPTDKPLCINLTLSFPHPPYAVEDPWYSLIDRDRLPPRVPVPDWENKPIMLKGIWERQNMQSWSEERWLELRATYYGMAARVDHQFGLVMGALRDAGIYDDTAVFMFSDHGDYTGDYGLVEKNQNTFEDCLTRVPFIVKPPSWLPVKPRVTDALVELIDFPATVEAVAGLEPQHTHFGHSLLDVVAGDTDEHRDAVFCEGGRLHGETHCMEREAPQSSDFLYWPRLSLQGSEGPEHTKATMCRTRDYKYVRRLYEQDELYDLKNDPGELENRIDDPDLSGVRAELQDRMLTFYQETCDVVPFTINER